MDQNERSDNKISIDKEAQINLVVNHTGEDEATIDLGRVFHNMKVKRRIYAWVLVLCLVVGICAPLLIYQFNKPMLTVSSVVTLNYEVPWVTVSGQQLTLAQYKAKLAEQGQSLPDDLEITWLPVASLMAPDGSDLDLNAITSAYVLSEAMKDLALSKSISLSSLRSNITVEKVLTDASRQAQELASKMVEDKNNEAYNQMQAVEMTYDTRFVVRLKNGFGEEDSKNKIILEDGELGILLNRILDAYNDYLVRTYADRKLPDGEIAEIRIDELDLLESLEKLQQASDNLYDYCDNQRTSVKNYRSYRDGRSLEDWMQTIQTVREVSIDYLYSYVYTSSIIRKPEQMLTYYENSKRQADQNLTDVREKIEADTVTKNENYVKPTVIVSMQESGTVRSTQITPDFYNDLILNLAKNYDKLVTLETTSDDLDRKIQALKGSGAAASEADVEKAYSELQTTKALCVETYDGVVAHMQEVMDSPFYKDFAGHTVPQGELPNFLTANLKNMIIGAVAGVVVACGLWFLAALAPEFRRNRKDDEDEKGSGKASGEASGKEAAEA